MVGMTKLDRVRDDLALCVHLYKLEATVGIEGGSDIKPVLGSEVPRMLVGSFSVDEYATTN